MALRYQEIKQALLELASQSRPHSKLPSRKELCERYLVTRTTVDRAVNELMSEGYLYSLNGSGTYVADHATNGLALAHEGVNMAVLLPNIMEDTYPGILRGIEDAMQISGVNVSICNTDNDFEKQISYIQRLFRSHVDGIIIIPAISEVGNGSDHLRDLLENISFPVVFCNRSIPGVHKPLVTCNDYYGGYIATKHLIEMGYRRIAFLCSRPYLTSNSRYQGYQAALWEAGIDFDPDLIQIEENESCPETGITGMDNLLNRTVPDAVFSFNDQLAGGAMKALEKHGLQCGRDIGLIGYDNTPICDILHPALTSVSYGEYENGRLAAEMLLKMILNPQFKAPHLTTTLPKLFIRESCPPRKQS